MTKQKKKWLKERKKWKNLLEEANFITPLGDCNGINTDSEVLGLYMQYRTNKALEKNQFMMVFLTALIVLLTVVNVWLSFIS